MEKRVILATILSTLVIILWFYWTTPKKSINISEIPQSFQKEFFQKTDVHKEELTGTDYVLETKSSKVIFNSIGAKIKNWLIDGDDIVLQPLDNSFIPGVFSTFSDKDFKLVKKTSNTIIFTTNLSDIKILKEYHINDDGFCKLNISFENLSKSDINFELPIVIGPGVGGTSLLERKQENSLTRALIYTTNNRSQKILKLRQNQTYTSSFKWVAIGNKYFVFLVLNNGQIDRVDTKKEGSENLIGVYLSSNLNLEPGQKKTLSFDFYIGPKLYSKLAKLGYGLENVIDFGFFSSLSKLAFFSLKYFYNITKNYGIAIIILTIIIQLITLPLTLKSYKSAKQMKILQPKIKELQIKYKNDPKRLNAEIMYLYKSQKVNPLGGCLPMLIQLPIFWALFTTLRNTYELKKAPFLLWINDLSSPDLLFNLAGIPVRILPLLMGISMFVQQKLTGSSSDPSQKTFTYLMPAMFTVIFWNFPSGLVLYWFTNSVLSIGIQSIILRQPLSEESKI